MHPRSQTPKARKRSAKPKCPVCDKRIGYVVPHFDDELAHAGVMLGQCRNGHKFKLTPTPDK